MITKFEHNKNYVYEPILLSGMYIHPNRVYKGYEKPFIAKVDLSYKYNFYNGYTLNIKKGDAVYIVFNSPINNPINYEFEYYIQVRRNNEVVNHWSNKITALTYNYTNIKSMVENLRLQLEGKEPCLDVIMDNVEPCFDINVNDTFVSFAWDNGLIAKQILRVDKKFITYKEYYMNRKKEFNYSAHKDITKVDLKHFIKYSCKVDFDINKVKNNEIFYSDLITKSLENKKIQDKKMFEKSYKKQIKLL